MLSDMVDSMVTVITNDGRHIVVRRDKFLRVVDATRSLCAGALGRGLSSAWRDLQHGPFWRSASCSDSARVVAFSRWCSASSRYTAREHVVTDVPVVTCALFRCVALRKAHRQDCRVRSRAAIKSSTLSWRTRTSASTTPTAWSKVGHAFVLLVVCIL